MKTQILVLSFIMACGFSAQAELAESSSESVTQTNEIKMCSEYRNFTGALPDTVCKTKKGGKFKKVVVKGKVSKRRVEGLAAERVPCASC